MLVSIAPSPGQGVIFVIAELEPYQRFLVRLTPHNEFEGDAEKPSAEALAGYLLDLGELF